MPTQEETGDITERKRIEVAWQEKEKLLSESQRIAHIGSWIATPTRITWSDETYRIYGVSPDTFEPSHESFISLIHPEDRQAMEAWIVACLAGEKPGELEFRSILPDGSLRILCGRGDLHYDGESKPAYLAGTVQDITDRKRAEQQVEASERRFRALIDNSWDGIVLVSEQGEIVYSSPAVTRMLGYLESELHGRIGFELIHPDDLEASTRLFEEVLQAPKRTVMSRHRLRQKEGSWRWVEFTATNLLDDPSVGALVVNFRDITKARRAEELQREQVELASFSADVGLALSKSHTLAPMLQACAEAMVRRLNGAFARIWLLNPVENVLELSASAGMYTHLDGPHHRIPVGKFKIGLIAQEKKPHLTNDVPNDPQISDREWARRESVVAFAGFPLLVEDRLVGVMAMFARQPLSDSVLDAMEPMASHIAIGIERKRNQDTADLLRSLVEKANDAIEVLDPATGRFLYMSQKGCSDLGYAPSEIRSLTVADVDPQVDLNRFAQNMERLRQHGPYTLESAHRRKDGTTFPVEITLTRVELDRDYIVAVARDITERRQLEAQLRQAQKMEAIGQLAGGVAHDFNNMLTVISGYCEVLLTSMSAADSSREVVNLIRDAGERAASLTRQLLAFSRKAVLEPKVLDLNMVVKEMEKMLQPLIGEDIVLSADLDPLIDRVRVDPGQLGQVLMNLAVNTRDAMPKGGKLTIETRNVELDESFCKLHAGCIPGKFVRMAISDTGHGMPPEVKARIFEPFFTTKEAGKGTGLGLSVVYGIIKQSEGYIEVSSEPSQGTTFRIYFPAVRGDGKIPAAEPAAAKGPRGTETLLLVDDEEAVRGIALFALQTYGYEVLTATDGQDALRVAAKHPRAIDLLVTDLVMPGMSGGELADALRQKDSRLKVLFISGYTNDAVIRQGLVLEEVSLLQKPFSPLALARKVRAVLDERE